MHRSEPFSCSCSSSASSVNVNRIQCAVAKRRRCHIVRAKQILQMKVPAKSARFERTTLDQIALGVRAWLASNTAQRLLATVGDGGQKHATIGHTPMIVGCVGSQQCTTFDQSLHTRVAIYVAQIRIANTQRSTQCDMTDAHIGRRRCEHIVGKQSQCIVDGNSLCASALFCDPSSNRRSRSVTVALRRASIAD
jgi:hypothetical protein